MQVIKEGIERSDTSNVPLFTVIVLSYNNKQYISEAIKSVFLQDYPRIQLLVADDGSRDFDREYLEGLVSDLRKSNFIESTIIHHEKNLGTVKNINSAIKHCRGTFIKLLAADDALYDSQVLSAAASAFKKQGCDLLLCSVRKCDKDLKPIINTLAEKPLPLSLLEDSRQLYASLCRRNLIMAGSVFLSKNLFERLGNFDERYRLLEDWPMWLKAAREGLTFGASDFTAVDYRTNQGVSSGYHPDYIEDKKRCFRLEIAANRKQIGLMNFLISYAMNRLTNSRILRRLLK